MIKEINKDIEIDNLYSDIKNLIINSRNRVYRTVNIEMINLYWNMGKMIVKKQDGNSRAKYKDYVIENISKKLTNEFGKGFSVTNLKNMRKFYCLFPIGQTLSDQLTWSHYYELIKIEDETKRKYYMKDCIYLIKKVNC